MDRTVLTGSCGPTPVLTVHGINQKSGSLGLKNRFSFRFSVFTVQPPGPVQFWKPWFIGLELWTIRIENLCWLVSLIITIGKFVQHHKLIPHPLFFQFLYVNVCRSYDFLLSFMLSPHEETKFEWDIYSFWTFPANPVLNPVISLSCKIWVGWGITLWCFFLFDCLL